MTFYGHRVLVLLVNGLHRGDSLSKATFPTTNQNKTKLLLALKRLAFIKRTQLQLILQNWRGFWRVGEQNCFIATAI
jgi:hypothetical protein